MNYKEVHKILEEKQNRMTIFRSSYTEYEIASNGKAIEAVEKQIPKKLRENTEHWAVCPNCGGSISKDNIQEHITNGDITFCEHCGQAIDWSGEELKPCPFCGGNADLSHAKVNWLNDHFRGNISIVSCHKCHSCAGFYNHYEMDIKEADQKAKEAWNRRANENNENTK